MVRLSVAVILSIALGAIATPRPLTPDPSGAKNVGNGQGQQFITGGCLSNADCASTCCATAGGQGICSGIGAQFQAGKTGCGFGGGQAAAAAAPAPATPAAAPAAAPPAAAGASSINQSAPGAQNVGTGQGTQFITGQCLSNADCASGCCAAKSGSGVCSAVAVANEQGKQGCGFVGTA